MSKQFMSKLIKDTLNGEWDGGWSVNAAGDTFTFIAPKEILTKAFFQLDKDKKGDEMNSGMFVFSNGQGINFDNLIELKNAVLESLLRTVIDEMNQYDGPLPQEDAQDQVSNTDQETLSKPSKPEKTKNKVKGEN